MVTLRKQEGPFNITHEEGVAEQAHKLFHGLWKTRAEKNKKTLPTTSDTRPKRKAQEISYWLISAQEGTQTTWFHVFL